MLKDSFEPYERIVSFDFHLLPDNLTYIDNYKEMFINHHLLRWLGNSLVVSILAVTCSIILDTMAAFALSRLNFPGKNLSFNIILMTIMIPIQVILVPLYLLMIRFNWLNTYTGLIVPIMTSPFGIFLLRQNFIQIPHELDEAAMIDGANYMNILFKIIIPNSLAAIGTVVVIKFMWVWGDYLWPSLVTKDDLMRTLPVGIAMLRTPTGTVAWDLLTATSVIAVIPIIIMFIYLQKYFIKGLTEGAVKG
jgi:ABC-type glycerol-3-phosphate transport system permease component